MTETIELQFKFHVGDMVTHLLNPFGATTMLILDRSYTEGAAGIAKRYYCRVTAEHSFTAIWFHEHELRPSTPIGDHP